MRNRVYLIIFLLSAEIISCNHGYNATEQVRDLNITNNFRFDFPKKNGQFDSGFFQHRIIFDRMLKLQSLFSGFDSLIIRLHYGGAMVGERLVQLICIRGQWTAEVSELYAEISKGYEDSMFLDFEKAYHYKKTTSFCDPNSGWDKFINQLFSLGILTLPDQEAVHPVNYGLYTDGTGVSVEVASKNIYRLYGYSGPEPDIYKDYLQDKNMAAILEMVDKELGLCQLWNYTLADNKMEWMKVPPKPIKVQEMRLE